MQKKKIPELQYAQDLRIPMLRLSLGIDTSNYKTSVALVTEQGDIICNLRKFLDVKKGERGLRQSVALFQHVNNLPKLFRQAFDEFRGLDGPAEISCISVSDRPRPIEGSYMPCFLAGLSAAETLAASLNVPCLTFSHQEGHIEAVRSGSSLENANSFLSFHFSGGTTEALFAEECENGLHLLQTGGSRDIAFGQVLDRVGVYLGMEFPCGEELDRLALSAGAVRVKENPLPRIRCLDGYINLSGIETRCRRMIETHSVTDREQFAAMLFTRIGQAVADMCSQLSAKYHTDDMLLAGGVSSSRFIRDYLIRALPHCRLCFGSPELSADNAVGIALLGGKHLWR